MTRRLVFAAIVIACVGAGGAYVAFAGGGEPATESVRPEAKRSLASIRSEPYVLYRTTSASSAFGGVEAGPLQRPGAAAPTGLRCLRVYYAAGRGVCLTTSSAFGSIYVARIFDRSFRTLHEIRLGGQPSRARISPDGRYGAATVFVAGHSYASPGKFSTATTIFSTATGRVLANLEQFRVTRDGRRVDAPDVNYWGVTFARNSDRFYATLATGGRTYLIEGSVSARTAHTLHENVECPSLSPDGTRIAYKKRVGTGRSPWQLTVLDLRTMKETPLADTREVDDQAEWLDNDHVLYSLAQSISNGDAAETLWIERADGKGSPKPYLSRAASPTVVR